MTDLIIDNEFRDLLPPLPADKRAELEKNLLRDGIRDPLVLWNGILIDGHNRYEIAKAHGLDFKTEEMKFASRDDVKLWMVSNQFARRDFSAYERAVIALKLKPSIAALAKENQAEYHGNQYESGLLQKSAKVQKPIDTRQEVAKLARVSHDTIAKVEKIEAQATPEIKKALRTGDLSINAAYEGIKAGAETVADVIEVKKPHVTFNTGNNEWYTPKEPIILKKAVDAFIKLVDGKKEIHHD